MKILNFINTVFELIKIRMLPMVWVAALIGYYVGSRGEIAWGHLALMLSGMGLVAGGAAALNQVLERDTDALMERTRHRPLPSGRMRAPQALGLGVMLVLTGVFLLAVAVNLLTAFFMLLAAFLYVVVYTPLKRLTWLNTLVGTIPGAIPPLAGWTAATGHADVGGWILFAILAVWQLPHFYPIAFLYKDDYARGGIRMLSVVDPSGRRAIIHTVATAVLLIPVSLVPSVTGMTGEIYSMGVFFLSSAFAAGAVFFAINPRPAEARGLVRLSLAYLPALLALITADANL